MHNTTIKRISEKRNKHLLCALLLLFSPFLTFHSQIPNYVPSNSLVGWWPFTGNAIDSSGNGNNGTVNGATLTTDRFGAANSAYSFDGINDDIFLSNQSSLGSQNKFSISMWINVNSYGSAQQSLDFSSIYMKNNPWYSTSGWSLLLNRDLNNINNRGINLYVAGSSPYFFPFNFQINTWYHVILSINNNTAKLYINNTLINSISGINNLPISNTGSYVGNGNTQVPASYLFPGKIDDIGIWNRALTECEIQNLYQAATLLSVDDISICQNGTGTLVAQTSINGGNFQWSNGPQSSSISVSPPSTNTYYVSYTLNGLTCTDSAVVNVIPNQPAFFPIVNPICAGDPLAPLPTSSLNLFQGTWSPPINNMATTTYTFTPNLNVCAWDTTTLTIIVKPVPVLTSQDISTCIGQEVTISSTPDLPNGTFNWSNNTTASQFILTADTSTFYTATYTLDGCTSLMDTVNVVVNALPIVSITPNGPTTFCAESSVELTSSSNYGNMWNTNENTQNITASVSGTYELMVTDSNGCVDSASIVITNSGVPCLQIGGVFTPNGDGSNDTWQIIGIENYPDATVEIFNRWGQQLFYTKGYSVPWNGTYNNESLPTGDYFYIIDLGINDPIKGALTIKN
jgi:gliding motility-associated-like protein